MGVTNLLPSLISGLKIEGLEETPALNTSVRVSYSQGPTDAV